MSNKARSIIQNAANEILVSAASAWEVATKVRLGKLDGVADVIRRFDALVAADGFTHLPINYRHALRARRYGLDHRDTFDRMLAAQAELVGVPLITLDPAFAGFPVNVLW